MGHRHCKFELKLIHKPVVVHRHKEHKQSQDQLQLKDEDIYGHKLMSPEELHQYRERLRALKTEEERNRFEAQHREEMQTRAKALQIELEDAD